MKSFIRELKIISPPELRSLSVFFSPPLFQEAISSWLYIMLLEQLQSRSFLNIFILQNVTVICAGKRALLQCNPGKMVKVTQARWGDDTAVQCANATYPDKVLLPRTTTTDSSQVTDQLRYRCSKQQKCEVEASGPFLGEGSVGIPSSAKYLRVWHECIPDASDILNSWRAKRDVRMQKRGFSASKPSGTGPELLKSYEEGLGTSGSLEVPQSFLGGKSNKQIIANRNESVARKEKRNGGSQESANLARMLDKLLAPSSLNK